MRILCLHGVGSSGAILEMQMASLRRELDPSFELVFVDGPVECQRGPGVSEYTTGQYYSHTKGYSPADMAYAVENLKEVLEAEGPFDGIFGFSQGAALALTYLHLQQTTGDPIAIRFAALFSSAMPCSSDTSLGEAVIEKLRARRMDIKDRSNVFREDLSVEEREFVKILQQTIVEATSANCGFQWPSLEVYSCGELDEIPRVIYASALKQKIQVPTIHVWGQNDFPYLKNMAELSSNLCEPSTSRVIIHSGLHDMPKKSIEIRAVLRNLDWAMAQA